MENNKKIRELYNIYLELGHEVFEEKIQKPMELYLHASSNVISINSLNTIIANVMEKSKLGEASFYENEIVINDCNKHAQTSESNISYKHLIFVEHLDLVNRTKSKKNIVSITGMKKLERGIGL